LHAELTSIGTDDAVVFLVTDTDDAATTRIGDRVISTGGPYHFAVASGLDPETTYPLQVDGHEHGEYLPTAFTTLARPSGELLATVATVNDVHFGETRCGAWEDDPAVGPILSVEPGETPYPLTMNNAAIDEMLERRIDAVIVKGDLTDAGKQEELDAFLATYGRLGERLHYVRGNHDAMIDPEMAINGAPYKVHVPGATLAVLDTVDPGRDGGRLTALQLDWLDALAAEATTPVLVFGHHHPWDPADPDRNPTYFGINPDDSERLVALFARRPAIAGYFAGHTHRNRVRRFEAVPHIPIVEVGCTKDYPGLWAEYRIYEGGYTQQVHRMSAPAAVSWTERTREMFFGLYRDYALGSIDDRCFTHEFR
ncbi:MAG: hypothetical protein EBX39_13300, partial [Actinobacteria bacterium]|nr:hypothetical protein [Actinomycetota bacterium]